MDQEQKKNNLESTSGDITYDTFLFKKKLYELINEAKLPPTNVKYVLKEAYDETVFVEETQLRNFEKKLSEKGNK